MQGPEAGGAGACEPHPYISQPQFSYHTTIHHTLIGITLSYPYPHPTFPSSNCPTTPSYQNQYPTPTFPNCTTLLPTPQYFILPLDRTNTQPHNTISYPWILPIHNPTILYSTLGPYQYTILQYHIPTQIILTPSPVGTFTSNWLGLKRVVHMSNCYS